MPTISFIHKRIVLLVSLFFLLMNSSLFAQVPIETTKHKSQPQPDAKLYARPAGIRAEICDNNIDDDGNGLADRNDFTCYFNALTPDTCIPTKMVWATLWSSLYWVDLLTNENKVIPFPMWEYYDDITWGGNGKLYGVEEMTGDIREIDPYTAQTKFVADIPGYYFSNGLTTDAAGNFYLTSFLSPTQSHIIRFNPATGKVDVIANLSSRGLAGAGDLTFLNGFLYASCNGGIIVKIDLGNNSLQVFTTSIQTTGYGLITLGDGYLYSSGTDDIYRIDPVTMETEFYYKLPTYGYIYGLTCYTEHCNAPGCRAAVKLTVETPGPLCSNKGVKLKGNAAGIKGSAAYTWTLPNGQRLDGPDSLIATVPGTYRLRYHTVPDTCGVTDSIYLDILDVPSSSLGDNKLLCKGSTITLQSSTSQGIADYRWQDGSTEPQYRATQPGWYWLETSNACGKSRDSILLTAADKPALQLANDTLLCPETFLTLKNLMPRLGHDQYSWSIGGSAETITINQPGIYWLESTNTCGAARDSIVVTGKDSCVCKPFFPAVNLGADTELCKYDTLVLSNHLHNEQFRYTWHDGSSENVLIARQPGIYTLHVSTYCSTVTDTVIVAEKLVDCECWAYVPSAFTPNDDGKNDRLKLLSNCTAVGNMTIYNRWGTQVFTSNNLRAGWDGYYNGTRQPVDVYVYYITYRFPNRPGNFTKKGTVTLVR